MKACKDCRWAQRRWFGALECHHPVIGKREEDRDPVTGKVESAGYRSCSVNRMHSNDDCGYEGWLWEYKGGLSLMLRARFQALKHIRFCFPAKGCRIWRVYSLLGLKTRAIFCECGVAFDGSPIFCRACGTLSYTGRCDCTRAGIRTRPDGPYTHPPADRE
jgi:hypothetical protein